MACSGPSEIQRAAAPPDTLLRLVADYQNPAGRLHELLRRFGTQGAKSIRDGWADVLEVSAEDVPLHLGEVASLLRDVRDAAHETGLDAFAPIPGHLTELSGSIFPTKVPFSRPSNEVRPDSYAMQALQMLSAYLEQLAPEGKLPPDAEVEDLRVQFADLFDAVTAADLPPEIRRTLLHRLSDIITALEHLNIGGPDAVRRAAEALAISAVLYEEDAEDNSGIFTRLRSSAQKAWVAFTVVTTLANAVLTFERIADMGALPPAQEQMQLPAGDSPDAEGNSAEPPVMPS